MKTIAFICALLFAVPAMADERWEWVEEKPLTVRSVPVFQEPIQHNHIAEL